MYKFSDKKAGSGVNINEVLSQELHKPWNKKFRKEKCIQGLKIIIGQHLAEMGSLSSKNHQGMKYSLCVMDVFTKYA